MCLSASVMKMVCRSSAARHQRVQDQGILWLLSGVVASAGAHDEWLVIISSAWAVSDIIVQASQRERMLEHSNKSQ